jgi:predicted protein tyrosine phosphatase
MSSLIVSPYSAIDDAVRRHKPSHLLTLMVDPYVETPPAIRPERHLRVGIHDVAEPALGAIAPDSSHIADIVGFARDWDRTAPFLVHCWAGISRSTAAAYILLCDLHGPGHENVIAKALRYHAPHAQPNRLMVRHADALLKRGGRMIDAVDAIGSGRLVSEGEIVQLPLALDEL